MEWFIPGLGLDEDFFDCVKIYEDFRDYGVLPYAGGSFEQLYQHRQIIDYFALLDSAIPRPKQVE